VQTRRPCQLSEPGDIGGYIGWWLRGSDDRRGLAGSRPFLTNSVQQKPLRFFCAGVTRITPFVMPDASGDLVAVQALAAFGHLGVQFARTWDSVRSHWAWTRQEKLAQDLGPMLHRRYSRG